MNNNDQFLRLPAEWERYSTVMLALPHHNSDWADTLQEVRECYRDIVTAIAPYAKILLLVDPADNPDPWLNTLPPEAREALTIKRVPINDTWTRDYGPITTELRSGAKLLNDFRFNGWGLKFAADRDNMVNARVFGSNPAYRNRQQMVLEGGSIESDGRGTILTTSHCLLSPNRNPWLKRDDIEHQLCELLGASWVLWLEHGHMMGDDTDSHIDTLARLAPDNTILYVVSDNPLDPHYAELKAMEAEILSLPTADGGKFNALPLPLPRPIYDSETGERLPATYANFLILPTAVIIPTYAQPDLDRKAIDTIASAFPGRTPVGVDCRALIQQHGSLHCATMQLF